MDSLILTLGMLPPLPEPAHEPPAEQDPTDAVGRITIEDEVILVRAGDSQEDVQRRVDEVLCARPVTTWPVRRANEAIPLRPRPVISPFFETACEAVPAPRPRRADPDRKAKRKAQARARRKGRS